LRPRRRGRFSERGILSALETSRHLQQRLSEPRRLLARAGKSATGVRIPRGRGRPDTVLLWPPWTGETVKNLLPSSRLNSSVGQPQRADNTVFAVSDEVSRQTALIAGRLRRGAIANRSFDLRRAPSAALCGSPLQRFKVGPAEMSRGIISGAAPDHDPLPVVAGLPDRHSAGPTQW
jgi:hypothetical protein